ncbi:class I SAM-dependent methyltransferase [Halocatena halophila]|uniref:class I SAM-dependent methyltransferase n=1 Tax=Halocatena halophila TaxID=2814576 RepID=UPI002ED585D7
MSGPTTDTETSWNSQRYDEEFDFVARHGTAVVDLLDPQPVERILDLGCGTGKLTRTIDERAASAVGVDTSRSMIRTARSNAPACAFAHADAHHLPFSNSFDAVFSNAALHWMDDIERVCREVWGVLERGGRFVGELGGAGNVRGICSATQAELASRGYEMSLPWTFPTIGEFATLVANAGFELTGAWLFDRPTILEGDELGVAHWLEMFGDELLGPVPATERPSVVDGIEDRLRSEQYCDGTWTAKYRRLRFVAERQIENH